MNTNGHQLLSVNGASNHECELCGGFGHIKFDVPLEHHNFGKSYPCACRKSATTEDGHAQRQKHARNVTAGSLADTKARSRWKLETAADALVPQAARAWVVERLFGPGSVNIVYGDGGSGKTYAMLDLAVCVAMGKPWLGLAVGAGAVHYVDEEAGPAGFKPRLRDCLQGHGAASDMRNLTYTSRGGVNICNAADMQELEVLISETGAQLVFIDTWIAAADGIENENDAPRVQTVFRRLRSMAASTGAAIVILDHTNKGNGYRGSTAKKGAVDCMLEISSKPGLQQIVLRVEKARYTAPFKLGAVAHFGDGTFHMTAAEAGDSATAQLSQVQADVLQYVTEHGASTIAAIAGAVHGHSAEGVRSAVYALARSNKVRRANNGKRGTAAIYDLCD